MFSCSLSWPYCLNYQTSAQSQLHKMQFERFGENEKAYDANRFALEY